MCPFDPHLSALGALAGMVAYGAIGVFVGAAIGATAERRRAHDESEGEGYVTLDEYRERRG